MWHTWYAHADVVNQIEFLADAKIAADLGFRTMQIDAGWNIPPSVGYTLDLEGDYQFDAERFPDIAGMVDQIHGMGLKIILNVSPLVMGEKTKSYARMKDALLRVNGKPVDTLDPRLKKTHDFLLAAWEKLIAEYRMDGLWYDFMEKLPHHADAPAAGMEIISPDIHEAYTLLMKALYDKVRSINPDVLIVLRRAQANLNAKLYCTHVWPFDSPQDYHTNRRDVIYMKTFGKGVVTHACCTSWPISESCENVARHMASITLAGVPAISVKLVESPERHNEIIRAWLTFYRNNDKDLVMGRMIPLLPAPFSAAIRIESDTQAFFGFFEAVPGLLKVSKSFDRITLINAFSDQLATRLEGLQGEFQYEVFDRLWKSVSTGTIRSDQTGVNLNIIDRSGCFSVVLCRNNI
jgi:alpha-galactosidase